MTMELINTLLLEAIQGESNAEKRYLLYSEQAISEGYPGVAALFTGLSHAEHIHAANHKRAMEKNGYSASYPEPETPMNSQSTLIHLKNSIEGEKEEFTTMYPSFFRRIKKKHGKEFIAKIALLSIKWAADSEKNHYMLLEAAANALGQGSDMNSGDFYLCRVCGNLHYSAETPEELCSVCGHDLIFFSKVDVLV